MPSLRSLRKSTHVSVAVDRLRAGATVRNDVTEDHARANVLLRAGSELTAERLAELANRGVRSVRVHRSEVDALVGNARQEAVVRESARERAEAVGERESGSSWGINPDSLLHHVQPRGCSEYDPAERDLFTARYEGSVGEVEATFTALFDGVPPDAEGLHNITRDAVVQLTRDMDLFVTLGINPVTSGYPSKHSVQTAMVAMAVGTKLGLRRGELLELGIGCLVHDAGMLHLDQRVVQAERRLDRIGFLEITKHPVITFDLVQKVETVPRGSLMVAYQMHERCDGSGYPRGRSARQIHPLAKIAAVADVYVALVSDRPHRRGLPPYQAIVKLLDEVRLGRLDRHAVRGLLQTVSLFPVGSCVTMSDGRHGRVLRSTDDYTRPIIQFVGGRDDDIVDLRNRMELSITRAVEEAEIEPFETDSPEVLETFWE